MAITAPRRGGDESGGGGKPPTAAVSQVAPIARQYRNLATELWSEGAMRATSSMAACASFIALVVALVAAATASRFSAVWPADCAASATLRFISVVVAVC